MTILKIFVGSFISAGLLVFLALSEEWGFLEFMALIYEVAILCELFCLCLEEE